MNFFFHKSKTIDPKWNKSPLNEDDFYRLCKKHKVKVTEMPLSVNGFYYCVKGGHYIAIDSKLRGFKRAFVMLHEFAHFLMHVPDSHTTANFSGIGRQDRKEREADIFALCAIIPKCWIESKTIRELIEDEGIPEEMIEERLEIWRKWGF